MKINRSIIKYYTYIHTHTHKELRKHFRRSLLWSFKFCEEHPLKKGTPGRVLHSPLCSVDVYGSHT